MFIRAPKLFLYLYFKQFTSITHDPPPAFTTFSYFALFGRITNLVSTKYL